LTRGFQIPDSRFQIPDSRFQIPDFRISDFRISDFRFQNSELQISELQIQVPKLRYSSPAHLTDSRFDLRIQDQPRMLKGGVHP
jgi:hypothetical protein